jgi:hypothetical protein
MICNMSVVGMYIIFTFYMLLHVAWCMYIQYIQGLCQSRLSTADHALSLLAHATTAVWSLERPYASPPPNLSLLYFLCRASPYPVLRTFTFWWFCMTSACCLHNFLYNHTHMEVWEPCAKHELTWTLENCQWCGEPRFAGAAISVDGYLPQTPRLGKYKSLYS